MSVARLEARMSSQAIHSANVMTHRELLALVRLLEMRERCHAVPLGHWKRLESLWCGRAPEFVVDGGNISDLTRVRIPSGDGPETSEL